MTPVKPSPKKPGAGKKRRLASQQLEPIETAQPQPRSHEGKLRQSDLAYEKIQRAIARCELVPGSTVSESDLEKRFGLQRAGTRTALERLAAQGLVQPIHRRGYRIKPITLRDLNDLFQLREIIERATVRIAAGRIDEISLRRLDRICAKDYTPLDRLSEEGFLRANSEFHILIASVTGNERLINALRNVLQEMERIFHFGLSERNRTDEMRYEHATLMAALTEGNADAAERAICSELASSKAMVLDALMSSASLLDVSITTGYTDNPQSDFSGRSPA